MKRHIIYSVVLLLFILILTSGCSASDCEDGYAEYKPVFADLTKIGDDIFYVDETKVGPDHYENIKLVFEYHKVKYKVVSNKIMVKCRTWKNKELMMNFTKKAEDKDWLETQRRIKEYNNTNNPERLKSVKIPK